MNNSKPSKIPGSIIQRIEKLLRVSAEPHYAACQETVLTECVLWQVPPREIDGWLARIRNELIGQQPLIAYKSITYWKSIRETYSKAIVVCPSQDQFDAIRYESGSKYGIDSDDEFWINNLKIIDANYGINITGAGCRALEFILKEIPTGNSAKLFLDQLYQLSDSVLEGIMNANKYEIDFDNDDPLDLLKSYDLGDGRIALWFD